MGDNVFEPDLLVVLTANKARLKRAYVEGPPDLVVEILSDSSEKWDRGRKATAYANAGVPEYWILDPERRQLERFVGRDGAFVREGLFESGPVNSSMFPGLTVDLGAVWAD